MSGPAQPSHPATRVLVVDDEENIAYLVGSALRMAGLDVETAADTLADARRLTGGGAR